MQLLWVSWDGELTLGVVWFDFFFIEFLKNSQWAIFHATNRWSRQKPLIEPNSSIHRIRAGFGVFIHPSEASYNPDSH